MGGIIFFGVIVNNKRVNPKSVDFRANCLGYNQIEEIFLQCYLRYYNRVGSIVKISGLTIRLSGVFFF